MRMMTNENHLRILTVNAEGNVFVKHFGGLSVEDEGLHQMLVAWAPF